MAQLTQVQLDLTRMGMTVARQNFYAMAATARAMKMNDLCVVLTKYEKDLAKLCDDIACGRIIGSDAGRT